MPSSPDRQPEAIYNPNDQKRKILGILNEIIRSPVYSVRGHWLVANPYRLRSQLQELRCGPFRVEVTEIIDGLLFESRKLDSFVRYFQKFELKVQKTDALLKKGERGQDEIPAIFKLAAAFLAAIKRCTASAASVKESQEIAALKAAVADKDTELRLLNAMNERLKNALSNAEEKLKSIGKPPGLTDPQKMFLKLLNGPASLLGLSPDEIMEMFIESRRNTRAFKRLLWKRKLRALHPDALAAFVKSCPEPSLQAFLAIITNVRSQLIGMAVEEIVQQLERGGMAEDKWKFKKQP